MRENTFYILLKEYVVGTDFDRTKDERTFAETSKYDCQ